MGITSRLGAAFGRISKSLGGASFPAQGYLPTLGSTPSATGLQISQGTAMGVSTVYACVTIRSQDIARCTPRIYRPKSDGSRELVTDHWACDLLRRPNKQQGWLEWMEQQNSAYLLRGNAYAAKKRDSRGRIKELIPVNPDAVLVMESVNGQIFYNVNRLGLWQIAMLSEFPPTIAQEDFLHLRGLTFNALVGISTIGMARDAIGVAMGLEQQAARWMANGSRPSVVLESKKTLTEGAAARLKKQWDDAKSGLQNTGSTVILEEGLEAKALQLTSSDLAFIEQRQFQPLEIARFYRVPPFKLGMAELRGVNLVQINQEYVNDVVGPDLDRWEQKLQYELGLDEEGLELSLDETRLLRTDILTRYNIGRMGVLSGLVSTNEFRAGERLPPVPGGDEVRAPVNLAALGSDTTGTAPDGAGRPEGGKLPKPVAEPGASAAGDGDGEGEKAVRENLVAALGGETVVLDQTIN